MVFLLRILEGFSIDETGEILDLPARRVTELMDRANADIAAQLSSRVLIVEDEPLIALDLERIVTEIGHQVIAIARTHIVRNDAERVPCAISHPLFPLCQNPCRYRRRDHQSGQYGAPDALKQDSRLANSPLAFPRRMPWDTIDPGTCRRLHATRLDR